MKKNYDGSRYIAECIDIIHELASKVTGAVSSDSDEEKNINERTLRSLLTMHAYLITSSSPILKELRKSRSGKTTSKVIIEVEKALINSMFEGEKLNMSEEEKQKYDIHDYIKNRKFKEFCTSCKISDLIDNEINESIVLNVFSIICEEYPCFKEAFPTSCKTTF